MHRIDLQGTWELRKKGSDRAFPASIPGDTHGSLLAAAEIKDPYWGNTELDLQWIGREDWSFSRGFELSEEDLRKASLFLHFDSIDTCAEVRLNDQIVGTSRNMFARRRYDISKAARAGKNNLVVHIRSAEREAEADSKRLPYPVPHSSYPVQSPHRNLIRKVQCHSGWDWGPCLMVSGIYGEVYVGTSNSHRIEYVCTRQAKKTEHRWEVEVSVEVSAVKEHATRVSARLAGAVEKHEVVLARGLQTVTLVLSIDNPQLWWPAGSGEQPLYDLIVETDEDEVRKKIGFRKLEVVATDDEVGRSMTFRVNGRDIFCKGANWIPSDALPSRQTREVYEHLISSAVDANMNMLRVWGGGQYEKDIFYELCDEKGILIWHDFMFACATYPATKEFLAEVEEEVTHQVKRLQDHPCIAIWCGNNENLGALGWYAETKKNRDRYLVDYDRLYEGTIGEIVERVDPDRVFWPSSPSAGRNDYSDGWHDDTKGDMHYWSVWHEGKAFSGYYEVTPRFCSEFGFQSFPSRSTVDSFAPDGQRNLTSPVMEHHQRHRRGNSVIIESFTRYFRFPEGVENMLYLSQVQQSFAIKTAVEYWRSRRPTCMGALYWQLNDVWPVASWSSIEYGGKWKLLHYEARRFFQPVHALAYVKNEKVEVWGINDTTEARRGLFTIDFVTFGGATKESRTQELILKAESATSVAAFEVGSLPFAVTEVFLRVTFSYGNALVENEIFLTNPKSCELQACSISMNVRAPSGQTSDPAGAAEDSLFEVELSTDFPAFYVSIDPGRLAGKFDDNSFTLLPGKAKTMSFRKFASDIDGRAPDLAEVRAALSVYHLRGTYR